MATTRTTTRQQNDKHINLCHVMTLTFLDPLLLLLQTHHTHTTNECECTVYTQGRCTCQLLKPHQLSTCPFCICVSYACVCVCCMPAHVFLTSTTCRTILENGHVNANTTNSPYMYVKYSVNGSFRCCEMGNGVMYTSCGAVVRPREAKYVI